MTITFAGHSFISSNNKVKEMVKEQIRNNIIDVKLVTCYLGGYGDFDEICARACRELKQKYDDIEVVYVTPQRSALKDTTQRNKSLSGFVKCTLCVKFAFGE